MTAETGHRPRGLNRAKVYGDLPISALAMVLALQSGENNSIGLAVDGIRHDLHVSAFTIGLLPFAAAVVGVLAVIPFGILADRSRRTWLLAGSMLLWVLCMAANGAAPTFTALFLARIGIGAIEASSPAAISLIADYYPVRMRASKMGWYQFGALLGGVLGAGGIGAAIGAGGWRWGFYSWIPFGIVSILLLLKAPEPARGDQDADYHAELQIGVAPRLVAQDTGLHVEEQLSQIGSRLQLPPPRRVGTLDYQTAGGRQIVRELLRIRSMWYGVISITVSQLLLVGIGFWSASYFKQVHHLSSTGAGLVSAILGLGAAVGVLAGGRLSDILMARGHINGRIWIIAFASVLASAFLVPGFLSTNLAVTAPFFFLGGIFLLVPLAPSEAMIADVVVCELRGRATTVRSIVRTLSACGPAVIGLIIGATGIRLALAVFAPIYAVGGLLVLFALKSYGPDLAFVLAETQRTGAGRGGNDNEALVPA